MSSNGPVTVATVAPAVVPRKFRRDSGRLLLFFCATTSISFVWKALNRFHAIAERLQKRLTPPAGCIRNSPLISLSVGLGIEPHGQMIRSCVLLHRNPKLDNLIALPLVNRKEVKVC